MRRRVGKRLNESWALVKLNLIGLQLGAKIDAD